MKRKLTLLFFLMVLMYPLLRAQEPIRHLIFTYWSGAERNQAFYQLTNVGDSSINLERFTLCNVSNTATAVSIDVNGHPRYNVLPNMIKRLSGRLEPGESYLVMNVLDVLAANGLPFHLENLLPLADMKVHVDETSDPLPVPIPGWEVWGFDSVSVHHHLVRLIDGLSGTRLWYRTTENDSVLVDQVNISFNPSTMRLSGLTSVAGVPEATLYYDLVRKTSVKQGNTVWDNSRGISSLDSEWLLLPKWPGRVIYTAVKNFGNFGISIESETAAIDFENKTITVEWGAERGDSILKEFAFGPGMAWQYVQSPESSDSAYNTARDGDVFKVYACGNELQQVDFEIRLAPTAPDDARVFPKRNFGLATGWWTNFSRYYVTKYGSVTDTIGNVPFATRVDTMLAYLEMSPVASWEIAWLDGQKRVDLKHGDMLKVTAGNGTTVKEYFIDVLDYVPSANANLSAITWPDKPFFLEGWKEKTIPQFSPTRNTYSVTLPYGTASVPALKAIPSNLRASIRVVRATSLTGSMTERTTTFQVTAEDDSTYNEYKVIFNMEKSDELIQKYKGHPFISEVIMRFYNRVGMIEVAHAGDLPLDMSGYMFVRSTTTNPAEAILNAIPAPTDANFQNRYRSYVPGYKYSDDKITWISDPGKLYLDPGVNPVVESGATFNMIADWGRYSNVAPLIPITHKLWTSVGSGSIDNLGVDVTVTPAHLKYTTQALFIFEILNDSIFEGTKAVGDPADFRLVDAFGDVNQGEPWQISGVSMPNTFVGRVRLKSEYYQGVKTLGEGNGTNSDDSRWIAETQANIGAFGNSWISYFGSHSIDPVTSHFSTISSLTYLVSEGYEGLQSVQGVLTGKTLEQFYMQISKADPGQQLTMKSGADGSEKSPEDLVAGSDTLVVLSADGTTTTRYLLIDQPLDSDAVLVAKEGSGYAIEIDGSTGKITGLDFGVALKEVLDNVIKPTHAILNVIDINDNLVPLSTLTTSSEFVEGGWVFTNTYVDTKTGNDFFFEVVAQDGVTVITYSLEPDALASDAYVISSVYHVDQDSLIISGIPFATSVPLLFQNIDVVRGASARVYDKSGVIREMGIVWFDDRLMVTSEDQTKTVTYFLDFLTEMNPDRQGGFTSTEKVTPAIDNIVVYPNPANERFYIRGVPESALIYLTDVTGRIISITPAVNSQDGISLSGQDAGIYLILVREENVFTRHAKIFKQ